MDPNLLAPLLTILLLPLVWVATAFLLATLSGWRRLAARHRDRPASGRCWRARSGMIGWVGFNHILTIELDANGLRFSVPRIMPFFPAFHLDWDDIASLTDVRGLFRRRLEIVPRGGGKISLFRNDVIDAVLAASRPETRDGAVRGPREQGSNLVPIALIVSGALLALAAVVAVVASAD